MAFALSPAQQAVKSQIQRHMAKDDRPICVAGVPGSGRFTVLLQVAAELAERGASCVFVAGTRQEAHRMQQWGVDVRTFDGLVEDMAHPEVEIPDVLVVTQPEICAEASEMFGEAVRQLCVNLVICVDTEHLYAVVSDPAFDRGFWFTSRLTTVVRQRHGG